MRHWLWRFGPGFVRGGSIVVARHGRGLTQGYKVTVVKGRHWPQLWPEDGDKLGVELGDFVEDVILTVEREPAYAFGSVCFYLVPALTDPSATNLLPVV